MAEEPRQNKGRELVDHQVVEAPSNLIAGRPMADLLFCFFSGLRCDVLFFIVHVVRNKI